MDRKAIRLGCLLATGFALASAMACSNASADTSTATKPDATPAAKPAQTTPRPTTSVPATKPAAPAAVHISADGRLAFINQRSLTFGTNGKISQVNVAEQDKVTGGQVLAKLDTITLDKAAMTAELAVKAAELALKTSEADRALAEISVQSAETDIKTVQANVKSASIDLDLATDSFRKISYPYTYSTFTFDVPQALVYIAETKRQLNDAGTALRAGLTTDEYNAISRQLQQALDNLNKGRELLARGAGDDPFPSSLLAVKDFWTLRAAQLGMDKAQLTLDNASNAVSKSGLALNTARTALGKAQVAVDRAKNDLDRAKNDLDKAKDELDKAVITAPFSGVIARVNSKAGDLLTSGNYASTVVFEIIDPAKMELVVKINEIDIPRIKPGQKVTVTADALAEQRIEAVVTSVGTLPVVESGVVSYEVKTTFAVPSGSPLRSGMAARADITIQ